MSDRLFRGKLYVLRTWWWYSTKLHSKHPTLTFASTIERWNLFHQWHLIPLEIDLTICNWNTTIFSAVWWFHTFSFDRLSWAEQQTAKKAEYHWIKLIFEERKVYCFFLRAFWKVMFSVAACLFYASFSTNYFFTTSRAARHEWRFCLNR